MNCKHCNIPMQDGKVITNRLTGMPDFVHDDYVCTVSPDPRQAIMTPCWKCPDCGYSVTKAVSHD